MNTIEEKLWNYIDGACTTAEHAAITALIASDELYKAKYEELLKLNQEFAAMELDEPSMAFTYNVMEGIRNEKAAQPLKAAIDKRIIWTIAGFFSLTILALVIASIASINWQAGGSHVNIPVQLKMPKFPDFFNGTIKMGFIFFDIVLCLFLFDNYLRKKLNNKHAH